MDGVDATYVSEICFQELDSVTFDWAIPMRLVPLNSCSFSVSWLLDDEADRTHADTV